MTRAELAREVFESGGGLHLAARLASVKSAAVGAEFYGSAVPVLIAVGRDETAYQAARMAARAALFVLDGGVVCV